MDDKDINNRSVADRILNNFNSLINAFPDSPSFLGEEIYYPKSKRSIFRAKLPDLQEIRNDVQKFSERKGVNTSRETITQKLKKIPDNADLHALKAIQQYNDIAQSGVSENKAENLREPLVRIAKALHNNGASIFNTIWFITIYVRYLEVMRERLSREYAFGNTHPNSDVRKAAQNVYAKLRKLPRLIQIKNNTKNLTSLNKKLKDSTMMAFCISAKDLRQACKASAEKDPQKLIHDKPANSIIAVMLTLNSIYARVPLLRKLVENNLKSMPDLNRDIILQKQAIMTISDINDFLMAVSIGQKELALKLAEKIYRRSAYNIEQYLENAILSNQYEVDPYLKQAWIVKESNNLFEVNVLKSRLKRANDCLNVVISDRCQHRASLDTAMNYRNDIVYQMKAFESAKD